MATSCVMNMAAFYTEDAFIQKTSVDTCLLYRRRFYTEDIAAFHISGGRRAEVLGAAPVAALTVVLVTASVTVSVSVTVMVVVTVLVTVWSRSRYGHGLGKAVRGVNYGESWCKLWPHFMYIYIIWPHLVCKIWANSIYTEDTTIYANSEVRARLLHE